MGDILGKGLCTTRMKRPTRHRERASFWLGLLLKAWRCSSWGERWILPGTGPSTWQLERTRVWWWGGPCGLDGPGLGWDWGQGRAVSLWGRRPWRARRKESSYIKTFSYRFIVRAAMLQGWFVFLVFNCRCFLFLRNKACSGKGEVYHAVTVLCMAVASFRVSWLPLVKLTVFNARFKNHVSLGMFQTCQQREVHSPRPACGPNAARVKVPPSPAGTSLKPLSVHSFNQILTRRPPCARGSVSGARSPCSSQLPVGATGKNSWKLAFLEAKGSLIFHKVTLPVPQTELAPDWFKN